MRFLPIPIVSVLWVLGTGPACAADDGALKVTTQRGGPAVESVAVFRTKDGKRDEVGPALTDFAKAKPLPGTGPFEVWVKPKGGLAVKVHDKLVVPAGTAHELKLGDVLGVVEVFGDTFPRADKIVLTDTRDPGPGEKGHVAVQSARDYRTEMAVPPGTYAVWVVPANGACAQKVEDNVRVQAGRSVKVGD
ncbi:hypothetical protein [Frigoriglobus tundricola]|uniref:Carboxypeptidase regulatory-like domain-containing protein n=1 Tax=Frigoriglobus tundricola TaxID=2774151 RepID=A0A6M5YVV5_9BACT|nr:hypothetical protein [Frigoriglobus tundricola]QJW97353.1 hypothetical protein FTUN_4926 [Frigoriglobus tundricola]